MIWSLIPISSHLTPLSPSFTIFQQHWPSSSLSFHSKLVAHWDLYTCYFLCLVGYSPSSSPGCFCLFLSFNSNIPSWERSSIATLNEVSCLYFSVILTSSWNHFIFLLIEWLVYRRLSLSWIGLPIQCAVIICCVQRRVEVCWNDPSAFKTAELAVLRSLCWTKNIKLYVCHHVEKLGNLALDYKLLKSKKSWIYGQ